MKQPSQQSFKSLDTEHNPYSSDNHSLLPYLYLFGFFEDNIGYVIREPKTNQLIAVDMGEFDKSSKVIGELERKYQTQLKYILSTHHHADHCGGNLQWKEHRPDLEIITGALKPDGI